MVATIVEFWSRMDDADCVHPSDRAVFERVGDMGHGFNLKCLPCNFIGPIETAPIVLLFLSPGLSEADQREAETESGRLRYKEIRAGKALLPNPDEHEPAWRWWSSRTRCFGAWQELRPHLALLNLGGYHSATFQDWSMLASLPSSRATLSWAQEVLFPDAEAGKRIVVCLRSPAYWGLRHGRFGKSLFVPPTTRGGHMRHGPVRADVIEAVRRRIAQFSETSKVATTNQTS